MKKRFALGSGERESSGRGRGVSGWFSLVSKGRVGQQRGTQ